MPKILISYRTGDAEAAASRLYDHATARFGADHVALADQTLEFGETVSGAVQRAVGACGAVLVVIGDRWLTARDRAGRAQLDNPDDWVRSVIAAALARGIRVVPVLIDGASAPLRSELPQPIGQLADRHVCEIAHSRFEADADRLLSSLDRIVAGGNGQGPRTGPTATAPAGTASAAPGHRSVASGTAAAPREPWTPRPLLTRQDATTMFRVVVLALGARFFMLVPIPAALFRILYPDSRNAPYLALLFGLGTCFGLVVLCWHLQSARQLPRARNLGFLLASIVTALLAAITGFYLRGSQGESRDLLTVPILGAVYLALAHKLVLGGRWSRAAAAAAGAFGLYWAMGHLPFLHLPTAVEFRVLTWQAGYLLGMYGPLGAFAARLVAGREREEHAYQPSPAQG